MYLLIFTSKPQFLTVIDVNHCEQGIIIISNNSL
jgi:hypothetical protein